MSAKNIFITYCWCCVRYLCVQCCLAANDHWLCLTLDKGKLLITSVIANDAHRFDHCNVTASRFRVYIEVDIRNQSPFTAHWDQTQTIWHTWIESKNINPAGQFMPLTHYLLCDCRFNYQIRELTKPNAFPLTNDRDAGSARALWHKLEWKYREFDSLGFWRIRSPWALEFSRNNTHRSPVIVL